MSETQIKPRACTAHIRNVATGEVREKQLSKWDGGYEYMWTDGNYSCDCNRAIFFFGAGNPQLSDHEAFMQAPDRECTDGRFVVRITDAATGEQLYADEAW